MNVILKKIFLYLLAISITSVAGYLVFYNNNINVGNEYNVEKNISVDFNNGIIMQDNYGVVNNDVKGR